MTLGQGIVLGPIHLPIFRMLILVGILRVQVMGERISGDANRLDKLMIVWAIWIFLASFFHDGSPGSGPVYASGVIFNITLVYYLVRIWCSDLEDIYGLIGIIAILLAPIAVEMILEKLTGKNLFSVFGSVPENALIREGKIRSQGPFTHPILAGTVGATCIPLFFSILNRSKLIAVVGIVSGVCMMLASASSGPVMSLAAGIFALALWWMKDFMGAFRIVGVFMYLTLLVVMERPPYYLISKIDISGGSTGWHRCFLIEQTFKYLSEWWLFGTDHTRHWMPFQGTAVLENHTDVTNYYIGFGIIAGLPGMLIMIAILTISFKWVGKILQSMADDNQWDVFAIWCFGSGLFSHVVTGISVAYFDQSVLFIWMNVAIISSIYSRRFLNSEPASSLRVEA